MRPLVLLALPALLALGCREAEEEGPIDLDGDGFPMEEDCDDGDEAVNPDADEVCDLVDNDCDGHVDEEAIDALSWYADADADGYGDASALVTDCDQPVGHVANDLDCDDANARFHPGAPEEDCADPNDYNCDGSTGYADEDGDGWAACEDCDDSRADVNEAADEVCDEADNDCDGDVDEPTAIDAPTWYLDADADGYGNARVTTESCDQPLGYVADATDCDDLHAASYPGGTEICDKHDNDCNGEVDENSAVDAPTWYEDSDGDSWGADATAVVQCDQPDATWTTRAGDCDDDHASASPVGTEVCDELDNDCDGTTDEDDAVDASTWYADSDSDGYGDADDTTAACEQPSGYVSDDSDCDDSDGDTWPGADEYCDGEDDCDGDTDEDDAVDADTWYVDVDGDGYGGTRTTTACAEPSGYTDNSDDCDDLDDEAYPGNAEVCDTVDNDCDGTVDEDDASDASTWYADSDGDGYGDASSTDVACDQPSGYVANDDDCDDDDVKSSPIGVEVCDDADNDCNGAVDDDAVDVDTWYYDGDGDGYGDNSDTEEGCEAPSGYVADGGDCDDTDAAYSPGASEGCDGEDYDCDGSVDNDVDGDGYADLSCGGDDCDDGDSSVYPGVGCAYGDTCQDLYDLGYTTDGAYLIDPDGSGTGEDPIEAYCDMDTSNDYGWTLCASLTKGYVPLDTMYSFDLYAFQARLNSDDNYVYDTDAPARTTTTWNNSEDLNYGQFCRLMGTGVTETTIQAKLWNYGNNYGASLKNSAYDTTKEGVYSGNLFLQWFTNSSSGRTFSKVSGDTLWVYDNSNGYGGSWTTPSVGWGSSSSSYPAMTPYTHSANPWGTSSASCSGCTSSSGGYGSLPYGSTTILNNMSHSFWSGITSPQRGWSDCTANGSCDYHESGYGVWLFWVR